jgi:thiosulfate/3-mercaptopyruvate sulfurtransferase
MIFMVLREDQPVVVFTNTGIKGSVLWFALEMMGYDARLYSYLDWITEQAPDLPEGEGLRGLNETAL